jgi:hypothetical protein
MKLGMTPASWRYSRMTGTSGNSRYVALTTYRRDGRPVTTPVWAAPLEAKFDIVTANGTGKARQVAGIGAVARGLT